MSTQWQTEGSNFFELSTSTGAEGKGCAGTFLTFKGANIVILGCHLDSKREDLRNENIWKAFKNLEKVPSVQTAGIQLDRSVNPENLNTPTSHDHVKNFFTAAGFHIVIVTGDLNYRLDSKAPGQINPLTAFGPTNSETMAYALLDVITVGVPDATTTGVLANFQALDSYNVSPFPKFGFESIPFAPNQLPTYKRFFKGGLCNDLIVLLGNPPAFNQAGVDARAGKVLHSFPNSK